MAASVLEQHSVCLTQHGEDEVLGSVDLQGPLVVVLPLVVLAKLLNEPVQVLRAGRRPEVKLGRGTVRHPAGGRGRAVPEAAGGTGPTGGSRGRHVRSAGWFPAAKPNRSDQNRVAEEGAAQTQPPETLPSAPLQSKSDVSRINRVMVNRVRVSKHRKHQDLHTQGG